MVRPQNSRPGLTCYAGLLLHWRKPRTKCCQCGEPVEADFADQAAPASHSPSIGSAVDEQCCGVIHQSFPLRQPITRIRQIDSSNETHYWWMLAYMQISPIGMSLNASHVSAICMRKCSTSAFELLGTLHNAKSLSWGSMSSPPSGCDQPCKFRA
jgi:hypothetical protein